MGNVLDVNGCYGCGLCSVVCKHNVIDIKLDKDGFYQPFVIDYGACVDCGLCAKVCSYLNELNDSYPIKCYAAWSKDKEVLQTSTSGGVSYEMARKLVSQGYTFCGVQYNSVLIRAEHYLTNNLEMLNLSKGSKYLQSYTKDAFLKINKKEKNLVIGTPCQIASFRRYIELFNCADNFVLIDFFCHGVPSYLMWKKYLEEHSHDLGTIKAVTWRNKLKGWRNSYCITLNGTENTYSSWRDKDDFFAMFLGDACLGKACYDSCKFKSNNSAADIRIGDFWGETYKDSQNGVCAVLVYSEKAGTLLHEANLDIEEHSFELVISGQMKTNALRPWFYKYCIKSINNPNKRLSTIANVVRISKRIRGYINRLRKVLHV